MQIIGLGHYKRTGKDALANMIVDACYRRDPDFMACKESFAYKLKSVCHELYEWAGLREPEFYETEEGAAIKETVLPGIGKSPRQIWIDFGTKGVREQVYDGTWRDFLLQPTWRKIDAMIITDVRFPDECDAILARGGMLIRVERPGFAPGPDEADQALVGYEGWDDTISSKNLEGLAAYAEVVAGWLIEGKACKQN